MADPGAGEKLRVFISYSRKDSAEFADELLAGLEHAGFAPFLDRHDIKPGEPWEVRLGGLIEQSDTVVFVVSPEAVKSERCVWEVDWTIELSKRLLPVIFKPVPEDEIPKKLSRLQFVRFDTGRGITRPLAELAEALRQDLDWIREHTRLGELAQRWEGRRRPESLLLRGDDLDAAKAWMAARKGGAPEITDAQRAFIGASEDAEAKRVGNERAQLEREKAQVAEIKAAQARTAHLQRITRWAFAAVAAVILIVTGILWANLRQSMAALYATHAETFLRTAVSDRAAQWPPALRARVILRSAAYMEMAASLGSNDRWFHDNILPVIFRFINQYLPTNTNAELQQRARRAFASTSREVLGRQFAVLSDLPNQPVGKQSPNCTVIGTQSTYWQRLVPERDTDEQRWERAFRVQEAPAHGAKQGSLRLEFGAADHSNHIQLAASDIQLSLPSGAWLCLSPDATVLSLSASSLPFPDIYELQWMRCAPKSKCKSEQGRDWRVRYVPIRLAPGAERLPRGFPCVISIRALPNEPQAAKFQLTYYLESGFDLAACTRSLPSKIYAAEFFTGLAVPRAVQVPAAIKDLLTGCHETSDDTAYRAIYTCQPSRLIDWKIGDESAKFSQNNKKISAIIEIVKRGENEPDALDVSVMDDSLDNITANVSLLASQIHRAGITESGDVLLQDDDANMTWRFVAKRSRLEALLRERGNCGLFKLDIADEYLDLEGLEDLDIDTACAGVSR